MIFEAIISLEFFDHLQPISDLSFMLPLPGSNASILRLQFCAESANESKPLCQLHKPSYCASRATKFETVDQIGQGMPRATLPSLQIGFGRLPRQGLRHQILFDSKGAPLAGVAALLVATERCIGKDLVIPDLELNASYYFQVCSKSSKPGISLK